MARLRRYNLILVGLLVLALITGGFRLDAVWTCANGTTCAAHCPLLPNAAAAAIPATGHGCCAKCDRTKMSASCAAMLTPKVVRCAAERPTAGSTCFIRVADKPASTVTASFTVEQPQLSSLPHSVVAGGETSAVEYPRSQTAHPDRYLTHVSRGRAPPVFSTYA